ncbi:AsmA family protein [Lichenihabitans psoromatis]|uniref:AsmA family protein n=1 Tax=Lichenihabitans psoromatis TaxID=2528642 RepID=UPI0010358425|nr:AsmA family protein [Lichenihabitans psoromatis]
MRDSLTVLAILLIAVLTTALVGPYFVDWNGHRGEIEARLSSLLGAKVEITGPIDVKLLPRPIFRLQGLTVSGGSARAARVSAERVDVELALTALLRGDIQLIDADLTRPHVTLAIAPDRSIAVPDFNGADASRVILSHLAVHDGIIDFVGQDGFAIGGIEGEGGAETLAGPFKFAGRVDTARGALGFRVATSAVEGHALRLKATIDPLNGSPKTELEGTVVSTAAPDRAAALSFDGMVTATGEVPLRDTQSVIPWRLGAKLQADGQQIAISDIDLRAGTDGRALAATGTGRVDLATARAAQLTLKARQVDLGKLAVTGADQDTSTDPIADRLAALARFVNSDDPFAGLPFPVTVDYAVDTLVFGNQTYANLNGTTTLAAGQPITGWTAIESGDGSRVRFEGSFEPGAAAVFKGRLDAASRDLERFADGLAPDLPDVADWLKLSLPVKTFAFTGAVELSKIGVAAHDAAITIDRSIFGGTITLTRAVGDDRARLFADLTSDALDLDALPDWRNTAQAASALDLSLSLSARALRLARTDVGAVDAGRIALQLHKTGSAVTLDRLSLADLGSATADLTGHSDGRTAHLEGRFDARKLGDLAKLIDRIAPGAATDALAARSDVLSPALLQVSVDAAIDPDGTLVPVALSLDGTAAGTKLGLHLKPDATSSFTPDKGARPPFTATLLLDAPESGALLRQLGIQTLPATAIGHGKVDASAHVGASGTLDGAVAVTLGDTKLSFAGRGNLGGEMTGHLTMKAPNVAPALRAVMLASPEPGAIWPADADAIVIWRDGKVVTKGLTARLLGQRVSGDLSFVPSGDHAAAPSPKLEAATQPAALTGALTIDRVPLDSLVGLVLGPLPQPKAGAFWLDTPFGPSSLTLPRTNLAVTIDTLSLTATLAAQNAKMGLRLTPGVLTLSDLTATLGDGQIGANVTVRRDGPAASVAGRVEWSGQPLGTPSLGGRSDATLDLAGTGATEAALVASLAGTGTVRIQDARLPRLDPDAITRVVASTDATTTIDEAEITQDLARELDHGALSLGTITTPVTIAAGVMRADPVKVKGAGASSETIALLDLRTLLWSMKTTATMTTSPKDWTGEPPQVGIIWKGPFAAPAREIDAAALVNGIAGRAIGRDQAKIEAFQADVRERALFSNKLKAIEAEQQAKRDKDHADSEAALQKLLQTPDATKPPVVPSPAVTPVPMPVPRLRQVPAKPLGLLPTQPRKPGLPPAALADPGSAGRY